MAGTSLVTSDHYGDGRGDSKHRRAELPILYVVCCCCKVVRFGHSVVVRYWPCWRRGPLVSKTHEDLTTPDAYCAASCRNGVLGPYPCDPWKAMHTYPMYTVPSSIPYIAVLVKKHQTGPSVRSQFGVSPNASIGMGPETSYPHLFLQPFHVNQSKTGKCYRTRTFTGAAQADAEGL